MNHILLAISPKNPIMPGVLIVEAMAQTAGAISLLQRKTGRPGVVYFMTIDNASSAARWFRAIVCCCM